MICIEVQAKQDGQKKWVILELQGHIHNIDGNTLNGLDLGTLEFVNDKPVLLIGNHLCEGSVVKLQKPIAILKKQPMNEMINQTKYEVEYVISEKYLFSSRPRPVLHTM